METQATTGSILRLPEVKRRTGMGRSSIYAYMKSGQFPASIRITQRSIGWDENSITAWIRSRIEQSNTGTT